MLFLPQTFEHKCLGAMKLSEDNLYYEAWYVAGNLGFVLRVELNEVHDPDYMTALNKAADFI